MATGATKHMSCAPSAPTPTSPPARLTTLLGRKKSESEPTALPRSFEKSEVVMMANEATEVPVRR